MKQALIVIGLGNGDEGKGATVDSLARLYPDTHTVVRFNGGAQAAHNVVMADGRHHTFAQFGSASFLPNVRTYHTEKVMLAPSALINEVIGLGGNDIVSPLSRLFINENAPILTPYHKLLNQMKERARGDKAHGSCGMGIGELMLDILAGKDWVIRARDLDNQKILREKLDYISYDSYTKAKTDEYDELKLDYQEITSFDLDKKYLIESWIGSCLMVAFNASIVNGEAFEREMLSMDGTVIFEGAQGVLLDEWHGFHPHTTWSTTTSEWAEDVLKRNNYDGSVRKIGVIRTYATRHGQGPLPTEDANLGAILAEKHNRNDSFQGNFRYGYFDAMLTRYAIACTGGIDELAITHLDAVEKMKKWWIYCDGSSDGFSDYASRDYSVSHEHDLKRQEKFGRAIMRRYKPVYETTLPKQRDVIEKMGEILSVRVGLMGFGPTADDRTPMFIPPIS